ncbi:midasin-like isoform X2 [Mercenaria mercenaria]|uniref:midasin-like isoform X2 n=1 Tax=Mercenaria mercenaria TaxID=6596 RepID=UPI00234EE881|nr:midasin-like isoform X2 [Mercenaria mercenaria]
MDNFTCSWSLLNVLNDISRLNASYSKDVTKFLSKQIWSPDDRTKILDKLSELFIKDKALNLGEKCRPILLDVVWRCRLRIEHSDFNFKQHQDFCISLSKCLHWPDIQRFTLDYITGKPGFTRSDDENNVEPKRKKAKKSQTYEVSVCRAAWLFACYLGEESSHVTPLKDLMPYLTHDNDDVRWFACQAVMEAQKLSSDARRIFLNKYFSPQTIRELKIRHKLNVSQNSSVVQSGISVDILSNELSHTRHMIIESDLCGKVTCIGGVLLSKVSSSSEGDDSPLDLDLLPVPSNEANLHSLALAVSSGSPVLLQGVVGSGKTSLVEHLARLTGRSGPPALMKIQMGDQMDSKALLGTYRCTEVPGEFIWQPGVLTQAVTHGYWVLMEDIDFAPMEVISVLLPLLETRTLSVPGHGDSIKAAPGFHLFATQRLLTGSTGWNKQQNSNSALLDKLWTSVLVEPLTRTELSKVLCTKYPSLETVVDKLLDIYFLLSAGDHQGASSVAMETEMESVGKFLSHDGRQISTRDLITWCGRIAKDFDVSSSGAGNFVFLEALDCFVACLSKRDRRIPLAEAIGAKLNITKVKVEYFNDKYKPDVTSTSKTFCVGRVTLPVLETSSFMQSRRRSTFSYTRQSSVLLERVAVCVKNQEPVLLVGETGTGKTSSVQYLAEQLGHKLHVINMNQQSDSADLLGGFKPVDVKHIIKPFYEDFELLFCKSFSRKQNAKFLGHLQDSFGKRKWENLFSLMEHTTKSALQKFERETKFLKKWQSISKRLSQLKIQVHQTQNALAFTFMEGSLVKAIRAGDWVLLDEINLAAMETLECLSGLLERTTGSLLLMERGDVEPVVRHPEFRLFACMNPATDVGKKDLSPGIRNRFTELFVDELEDPADLKILVCDYLQGLSLTAGQVDGIVKFYLTIRTEASKKLTDGTGHPPHYSLRTLCRALRYAAKNTCGSVPRSLYEGFCLSFLTQLDRSSHPVVQQLVCQHVLGKSNIKSVLKQPLPMPPCGRSLNFEGYWISVGDLEPHIPDDYILTQSVRANLKDLARVVSAGQHPVLLQGETSVGKTSLIKWLAQSTGNICVRVNNHEHTDLQEYVGCYAADENGKLAFKEGVLVEAMKKGQWIILDELNLAPTDVLEALNRLLDDNRELYIPETQETVKAHPKFMLFATQNPPGQYGGRKMLSRAFRNRFVELHFDLIPSKELETILHERCDIPLSYARRLVAVMLELQTRRRGSGVFAGKMGFMTLRDLFRWAGRYKCPEMDGKKFYDWDKHLADQGYMLLAGRVRKPEEADVIQEVIQKHFKCKLTASSLYTLNTSTSLTSKSCLGSVLSQSAEGFHHVVWTYSMRRLAVLIGQAIRYKEPILLVGETGCGKTTMCQLYAALYKTALHSVNCHLHTESADFLGGLRPVRAHSEEDKKEKLFEWVDGPLVQAMKKGAMFLIDEISLADDSVLERLNSVLELERTILLAEKGGGDGNQNEVEHVVAKEGFHVFATMNPGGDFGKKELSPALRNRFTEIWCPPSNHRQDLIDIIEHNLHSGIHLCNQEDGTSGIGRAMMDFVEWFTNNELGKRCTVSIRDILTWVYFINTCSKTVDSDIAMETEEPVYNKLDPAVAYIHGACLVFLDGLGAGTTSQGNDAVVTQLRTVCLAFLLKQVNLLTHQEYGLGDLHLLDNSHVTFNAVLETENEFSIPPFSIPKGERRCEGKHQYALKAPGTCLNAQRVLRALQLPRPLLLEGSPGVGKTSLVGAIARAAGRDLVRINLSEQTDVTDLFGADLPVEGSEGGVFAWRDGPLLQALKDGSWVVLDELNLASQSVLEGLNACLDHRAEVYIPELGKTFHIQHEKTRLFACQNPLNQGGGRKGLPRSFLNRFTQVYVEPLKRTDLMFIASTMYPDIPLDILNYMVSFNMQIYEDTVIKGLWGQKGSPWEFNLRDLFRWCDLLIENQSAGSYNPGEYVGLVYAERMRTVADKQQVYDLYRNTFPAEFESYHSTKMFHHGGHLVQIGHSFLKVRGEGHLKKNRSVSMEMLHHSLQPLESLMKCVEMNWMAILVGPSNCGKSSVVEILAQLSGNQLNVLAMNSAMDTTELLGGFEQADDNRHLEELAAEVHSTLNTVCEQCLLSDDIGCLDTVAKLQELWIDIQTKQMSGDRRSNVEELELMKNQVVALLKIMGICKKSWRKFDLQGEITEKMGQLKVKLEHLKHKLSLAVAGQGGGAFEWIDSLLVRSLREGHWLLIDNVNFCSASVLDRLNALLEPHGVLSINERGVIDGEIPTIKPHPNFRLFLSMDPRHGEISRAMRNRGVEIFVPGEDDGQLFSDFDLRQIFSSSGLKSRPVFDWLLKLHHTLAEELPRGDKPSMQNLLQVCRQTVQQCNHGNNLERSLRSACYSVYVQRQRHTQSKQKSSEIVDGECESMREAVNNVSLVPELGVTPVKLPGVSEYTTDPASALVMRNSAMFVHLLEEHRTRGMDVSLKLKYALNLLLQFSTRNTLQLNVDWLQNFCKNYNQSEDVCKYGVSSLLETSSLLTNTTATPEFMETLLTLTNNCVNECPLDLRWNVQLYERFVHNYKGTDLPKLKSCLELFFNRLHVLQKFQVNINMARKHQEKLQHAVQQDKSLGKQTTHEAVVHLVALFPLLTSAVPELLQNMELQSYEKVTLVLHDLQWIPRLYETAAVTLHSTEAASRLALFWKWLHNKFLSGCLGNMSDSQNILAIVAVLQGILGKDDRTWKLFIKFWRSWGHPTPYSSEDGAKLIVKAAKLFNLLQFSSTKSVLLNTPKVKLIKSRRQVLLEVGQCLFGESETENLEMKEKAIQLLQSLLRGHGLQNKEEDIVAMETDDQFSGDQSGDSMRQKEIPLDFVQLWPLFEYSSALESWKMLGDLNTTQCVDQKLQSLVDYAAHYTPISPTDLSFMMKLLNTVEVSVPTAVSHVLCRLRTCCAVNNTSDWLEWSDIPQQEPEDNPSIKKLNIHQSVLSYMLSTLLSRADNCVTLTTPSNVKISAPLKSYTKEITQMSHISRHIWSHVGTYSNSSKQPVALDKTSLYTCLIHTLKSCKSLVDPDHTQEFSGAIESLSASDISCRCLENINQMLTKCCSNLDKTCVEQLQSVLQSILAVTTDRSHDLGTLGVAWINLGLFNMKLLAPQGPVDPVEKVAIKLQLLRDELLDVDTELEVLCMHHRLVTGQDLLEVSSRLVHPRVPYLRNQSRDLKDKIRELEQQVAYRPTPSQYNQLVVDIRNFMDSVSSAENVNKLVKKLQGQRNKPSKNMAALQEVELWERSQDKFIETIETEYPLYRDITTPFLSAVQQMVHGTSVLSHTVRQSMLLNRLVKTSDIATRSSLEKLVILVGKFPTLSWQQPSCHHLAKTLTSDASLSLMKTVLSHSDLEEMDLSQIASDSVLSSCLFTVHNAASVRKELTSGLVMTLTQILEMYVLSWQRAEEERKAREEEEASLYRYKSEVHGDERSEEEQLEANFQENFPQFTQDFVDLVGPKSFEDSTVHMEDDSSTNTAADVSSFKVTSTQMTQIFLVHQKLYKHLVNTDWYQPMKAQSLQLHDWIKPILSNYTAATVLTKHLTDVLSSNIDSQLLGGHLVVSAVQQFYILQANQQCASQLIPKPIIYDIYHDTNVPEVIQCLPVINCLRVRVTELQQEWPDHPTLKQLCEIMDRIESFPITCPVMKFLTGIELLLQTAQDWESNASQHVSMVTQLADISRLIVQWRKLELSCWVNALDTEVHKYRSAASKWWFHLYQVVMSSIQPQESSEAASLEDVIKSLKRFIEHATLGDFQSRLEMLLSFHCHLVTMTTCGAQPSSMETGTLRKELQNVLWNMYQFYSRFSTTVQSELDRQRAPIEKELKGFVKIARWSDINYWALKQATEKTHRTLHKHIKQFQGVLQQPVQGILGDVDTGATSSGADHSSWSEKMNKYQEDFVKQLEQYKVRLQPAPAACSPERFPLQYRLVHLCTRLNKHWRQIVSSAQYCQHIVSLDEFTGELIENIYELQALEVNRNEEKEKQKSEAKHINLRKRTALSDLFRYLAKLGLSYRRGLAITDSSDKALKVPPVDLSVSLQSDSQVQEVWSGCLPYFYKCVSRRAQFQAALVTPSKELGVGNIDRCRGFAEHLYKLLMEQHTEVTYLAAQYKQIRMLVQDVDRLNDNRKITIPQSDASKWNDVCKSLVCQVLEGLNQFLVILHCCPQQQVEVTLHPSPVPADNLHQMALLKQGDEEHKNAISLVQNLLNEVQISQTMLSGVQSHLFIWSDIEHMKTVYAKLFAIVPSMQQLCKLFTDPDSSHPNAFTEVLHFLSEEINSKVSEFETWHKTIEGQGQVNDLASDAVSEFSETLEQLISSILLVVQKQSKHHVTMETENIGDSPTEETEDEELCEGHLVKVIYEKLQQDRQLLECDQTINSLQSLLQQVVSSRTSDTYKAMVENLSHCAPLLYQYRDIVHHHVISNLATQRTMGKLLSVLLGMFTDLAAKGFCIPPELSDEMSGEGATEFCDMEEAGMGEGEGVKNVSDQIEDEDQLDEAKRPEDHNKEDPDNQPDVKSEENAIEMSEDFDAKAQDLEDVDKEKNDEENDDENEEDIDKQMGEVDEMDNDKLDEQMWGSDEEDNVDEEQKEESGPGDGKQSEPELVAKDDNADKSENDKDREQGNKDETEEDENDEKQKQNNLDNLDQDNYDDDQIDPYHGKQEEQQAPDDLDLPDDLHLDDDNDDGAKDDEKETDETGPEKEEDMNLPPEDTPDEPGEEQKSESEEKQDQESQDNGEDLPEETNNEEKNTDGKDSADIDERQDQEGEDEQGFTPQDESAVDTEENENQNEADDPVPTVEHYGKTSHDATENVEQSDTAQDTAGETTENEQQEVDGTGQASADQIEGHQGQRSTKVADSSSSGKRKQEDRQPGKSDSERSLGSTDQKYKKLKTTDSTLNKQEETEDNQESEEQNKSDLYEHVKDSKSHHDAQTLDVATAEQQEKQGQITQDNEEDNSDVDDAEMADEKDTEDFEKLDDLLSNKLKKKSKIEADKTQEESAEAVEADGQVHELPGEIIATETVARGSDSTIHTAMEHLHLDSNTFDLESLRSELENQLGSWTQSNLPADTDAESAASELWHRYEALTSSLAQDLCEQLRLVLEPSQATKLKGDYRTGKRLNMRKVIPYIASQFRKDKIWLRRTKPSKRQYQIMLAIDDSSSMVDNHSKQMAFESLALISNALTLLESGQLSICSFGEAVNVLHPFTEQFTSLSGAHLLQYLTFEQKKTKIAHLLKQATAMMLDARNKQQGIVGNPETSQLLLIVSDGRGLFMEGMEVVKTAVRQAREAKVFIVFVIIDNPKNKDSILDIKVPVFKQAGQIPEIKSYMDSFPFPFYIILRDINSLPMVLSDALRQWFELVTAIDR